MKITMVHESVADSTVFGHQMHIQLLIFESSSHWCLWISRLTIYSFSRTFAPSLHDKWAMLLGQEIRPVFDPVGRPSLHAMPEPHPYIEAFTSHETTIMPVRCDGAMINLILVKYQRRKGAAILAVRQAYQL